MWTLKLCQWMSQSLFYKNSRVSLALLMDLSPVCDFITSSSGHLENSGLLSYSDHPKADTFHNTISKVTFINITTDRIRKVFLSIGKLSSSWRQRHIFLKFWFLLRSSYFITGNKYCQLFSFKWQLTLLILKKMSAKCLSLNNHGLSRICSFKQKLGCNNKKSS